MEACWSIWHRPYDSMINKIHFDIHNRCLFEYHEKMSDENIHWMGQWVERDSNLRLQGVGVAATVYTIIPWKLEHHTH